MPDNLHFLFEIKPFRDLLYQFTVGVIDRRDIIRVFSKVVVYIRQQIQVFVHGKSVADHVIQFNAQPVAFIPDQRDMDLRIGSRVQVFGEARLQCRRQGLLFPRG